jgi:cell division protein FtsW (lipid II flippase)
VRPFGGGVGHAGVKAKPYTPTAFLANIPTDSWYVQIWAELGITGLILHLAILFFIILKGSYIILHIRDPELRFKMVALLSGVFGIMVSSYGNGVYGQMPTGLLVYTSMALVFMSQKFDDELARKPLPAESLPDKVTV